MRKSWLLCVLLGTLAWGQAAPATPPPAPMQAPAAGEQKEANEHKPAVPADTSASVPDNAPVITVEGVCPATTAAPAKAAGASGAAAGAKTAPKATAPKSSADCKTVITKAQFEKLAAAVAPTVTPQLKKQLAGVLPRLIAMSAEARKEGMDKTEDYKETLKFVQMQVLTNKLQQKVQKEAANIPDGDIKDYYDKHPEAYEQYNIDRLFVPKTKQAENEAKNDDEDKLTDEQKKAKEDEEKAKAEKNEAEMTKLADSLRARAAAGEDMAKLQKEAFDAAGMKVESPTVNLPSVRRTGLPQGHAAVFDLKAGEVSQVISDAGGHYIYKMNSKTVMPLDQARNEIHSKLQNDRTREKMDKLNSSFKTETNEAYFGPGGVGMPPPRGPRPRPMPGQPGAGAPSNPPAATPAAPAPGNTKPN